MNGYEAFARYYDELTKNVSYPKRAEYFLQGMFFYCILRQEEERI